MIIKTIGTNGQVTIGTKYAGQHVAIEEIEAGVWLLKLGDFVPHNEEWLHDPEVTKKLDRALEWKSTQIPEETDLAELERRLLSDNERST